MFKVFGVIPARYGSTRFPGKPLVPLAGKPLIQWVIEGARSSKLLHEIIVATDHPEIRQVAESTGCKVVMTDSDLPSGSDRIFQAVKNLDCDVVINIQGDEPLMNSEWIDPLVAAFSDPATEMATMAHPLSKEEWQSLNSVKVVMNEKNEALYFSRFPIPFSRTEPLKWPTTVAQKHIGIYGYKKSFLQKFCQHPVTELEMSESLEQLRALAMGARIKVVPAARATLGVDTPDDLKKVEKYLKEIGKI